VQVAGEGGGSVALQHDGSTVLARVPLADVAGKTRHMPDSFLHRQENRLSEEGYAYLKRLVPAKHKVGQPFV
jgi:6-phosphofructokinase 1